MAPVICEQWEEAEEEVRPLRPPSWELRRRMLDAVQYGDLLQLRALVRQGAKLDMMVTELPAGRGNLMDWAVHHKQPNVAMRLLNIADGLGAGDGGSVGTSAGLGAELAKGVDSAIYDAASHGFVDVLKALLDRGASAGQKCPPLWQDAVQGGTGRDAIHLSTPRAAPLSPKGGHASRRSALRVAAENGHAEAVAVLVKAGAWMCEDRRERVLNCARHGGFVGTLPGNQLTAGDDPPPPGAELRARLQDAILRQDLRDLEALVMRGGQALLLAVHRTDRALGYYRDTPSNGECIANMHWRQPGVEVNPVDWAALAGCPSAALKLMELQFWLQTPAVDRLARSCKFAVQVASLHGHMPEWLALLQGLLSRHADPAQLDDHGRSALHLACMRGNAAAAEALLSFGAWELERRKYEVLHLAIGRRVQAVVEAAGAAPGASSPSAGSHASPSPRAQPHYGYDAAFPPDALVDAQTDNEMQELRQRLGSSLAKAVRGGDLLAARALVSRGANIGMEVELEYGIRGNLVDLAVWHEQEAMALALIGIADRQGIGQALAAGSRHALFWAVRHDFMSLLGALLEHGADAAQRDEVCGSVLRFAVEQRRSDAAAALLRAGAWARELEKDLVLSLLSEQGLLRCLDRSCGRGTGLDAREHERLVAAALGAELPVDMLPSPTAVVA